MIFLPLSPRDHMQFAPHDAEGGHGAAPRREDAKAVHERLLEATRQAYLADDEDAFIACFLLPQTIVTQDGQRQMETRDDLRDIYRHTRSRFLALGVTDLIRVAIAAEYVAPDRIRTTHVSYVLQGRKLVTPPYPNTGELVRLPEGWRISSSEYGSTDPAWTTFDPIGSAPPQVDRSALPHTDSSDRKDPK